jgi:membrane protein implicated in regulation of membrane protease activity
MRSWLPPFLAGLLPLIAAIALTGFVLWYGDQRHLIDINEATVSLTAATIVLTGTAVIVAVLAAIGYQDIRGRAESAAREKAEEIARDVASEVATLEARRTVFDMQQQRNEEETADELAEAAKHDP